jgi:hypothetical protein
MWTLGVEGRVPRGLHDHRVRGVVKPLKVEIAGAFGGVRTFS